MLIAKQLKKTNVAEYLLYMWHVEDLIRALNADMEHIDQCVVEGYQAQGEQRKQIYEWYESLIDMMREEGVMEKGHVQLVKNTLNELEELHLACLQEGQMPAYNAKFYQLLPALQLLKSKSADAQCGDVEICFVFLYGIMQLKRQQKEVAQDTLNTQQEVSKLVSMLVAAYNENLKEQ
ncbi:MAG: DUF4924 family protein [Paludibacteraceae bacterium]|nr:DUF4924 family protein [Paludibacteraceae bacterium]